MKMTFKQYFSFHLFSFHFISKWVHKAFDFYPPKLPLLKQRRWWRRDHVLLPWNELLLPTNFRGRKPAFFFFVAMSKKKKRNHPCFSLMQPHTIFNMKMQCSVFLPHVLLTRCQFQRLKYSVCPSVYTDDLIFTRKNRFIIATCCLYCRTNRLRWLVSLSINTAIHKFNPRILLYQASYLQIVHGFFPT